ncbi:hypothetical protein GCM10007933_17640 [Zoogloea oryzae]|uniref:Peptidase M48 domain-containing protein n=1 Tax=Zoogloea oryzae TaxID=310767 RepID=A0ABQ6FC58_9RHOO|nr:M48 family metallopeptidase [Zoogloea oryzae]GLT22305.1 hypothetical protein GCM10007933_17640 [Zoogloea oryzae]
MMKTILRLASYALSISLLMGCATVAVTGRSQLNLVSDAELVKTANESFAQLMNAASSKGAVLQSTESPEAANTITTVNRVSGRIIDAAGLRGKYNWQVTVLKSNVPNAFVMPNGKIVVYTGLFPIVKTEAGLAAVIGHEVAHVVARHSAERASQVLLTQTAAQAADAALAAKNNKNRPAIAAALGLGAQYGLLLPFSRQHESEADRIGQLYMAKAGYDPAEAIAVWERMAAQSGGSRFEFTSTHPSEQTRQVQLRQWLPEAQLFYADRNRALPRSIDELQSAQIRVSQQTALAPVALQPTIREGYWLKKRLLATGAETTYRVDQIQPCELGQCAFISSSANEKQVMTTDFRISRSENPSGAWTKFSPAVREAQFPLRVGDAWEDATEIETSDGKKRSLTIRSQVVAYESLTVPAGTFMTYKIVRTTAGTRLAENWFSPEVRGMVKGTTFSPTGQEITRVLTDYQRNEDTPGAL